MPFPFFSSGASSALSTTETELLQQATSTAPTGVPLPELANQLPPNAPIMGGLPLIEMDSAGTEIQQTEVQTNASGPILEGSSSSGQAFVLNVPRSEDSTRLRLIPTTPNPSFSMEGRQADVQQIQELVSQTARHTVDQLWAHSQSQNPLHQNGAFVPSGFMPPNGQMLQAQLQNQIQSQMLAQAQAQNAFFQQLFQQYSPYTLGQLSQQSHNTITPQLPSSSTNLYLHGPTTNVHQETGTGAVPVVSSQNLVSVENKPTQLEISLQKKLNWIIRTGIGLTTLILGAFLGKTFSNGQLKTESKVKVGETTVLRLQKTTQGPRNRF